MNIELLQFTIKLAAKLPPMLLLGFYSDIRIHGYFPCVYPCIGHMHRYIASYSYLASGNFLLQPTMPKEIELHVVEVPSVINLDRPF